ncbi:MAG: tRNA (N(6)-L-threonylcarbamoyladenosine(37)-C(2))-methylthiotransferase MtaB [Defluviitaleaceae bacterium]|nr:tRNA (N(6)-L-threonylcarbamoyladenosine(37)-C(2))-methylthiotransferase MtaB [Defluviitaleaceae bacterium]
MKVSDITVAVATLGCKVNTYDADALLALFIERGYSVVGFGERADVYIINTCAVTNISSRKSRRMIRRARKTNPQAIVVAAGCYAQTAPDEVSAVEGVSIVIGTGDRAKIVEAVEGYRSGSGVERYMLDERRFFDETGTEGTVQGSLAEDSESGRESRTRAYIKVQDGCDNFCSYCIIPYARGRARSRELSVAVAEARALAAAGRKEIVVSGIHVASYGKDIENVGLADLLRALHDVEGIERLRLSSVEPTLITESFIALMRELPKFARNIHLSLQSGCDKILTAMNRRYSAAEYADAVSSLRRGFPEVAVTTDVIVGFPGETDGDFSETFEFVKRQRLSRLHVFPYSPKKGTFAADMQNQVSDAAKAERAQIMIDLGRSLASEFAARFVGQTLDVLYETRQDDSDIYHGYAGNYITVYARSEHDIRNTITPSIIVRTLDDAAYTY